MRMMDAAYHKRRAAAHRLQALAALTQGAKDAHNGIAEQHRLAGEVLTIEPLA